MAIRLTSDGNYFYDKDTGVVLGYVDPDGNLKYWDDADGKSKKSID